MKRALKSIVLAMSGLGVGIVVFVVFGAAAPGAHAQILGNNGSGPHVGVLPFNSNRGGVTTTRQSSRGSGFSFGFGHGRHGHHSRGHRRIVFYPYYPHHYRHYYDDYRYGRYYDSPYYTSTRGDFDTQAFDAGRAKSVDFRVPLEQRVAEEIARQGGDGDAEPAGNGNMLIRARRALADGWRLLAEGKLKEAGDAFQKAIEATATEDSARVGYALAIGQRGDLSKAAFHLRQAVSGDPRVLSQIALDPEVRRQVEELKERFAQSLALDKADVDSAFAVASLAYLLGEVEAAHTAIQTAIAAEDRHKSTRQLLRLIELRQLGANNQGDG